MNDSVAAVTSFSKLFWDRCAKNMIPSFLKFVSEDVPLVMYHEASKDGFTPPLDHPRLSGLDLHEVTGYRAFQEIASPKVESMIGKPPEDPFVRDKMPGSIYNFIWDALSYGKKGFAWAHAARNSQARYLYWIDSDVVFQKPVSSQFLRELFDGQSMIYYGRAKMYTETGIFAIDRADPEAMKWVEAYAACWEKAEIFKDTTGWTDCQSFDIALKATPKLRKRNLSRHDIGHVVPDSILGEYLLHLKGPQRKKEGR